MSFFTKKKILVTHNGAFHADDLFATATLSILNNGNIKIIRTRDEDVIKTGDYVYDVGGEHDPERNRFDHHQKGGAGTRDNGVPYAAFGLVWAKYGEQICGSKEASMKIDEELVQAIDAHDNGLNTYKTEGAVGPYIIESLFTAFRPTWKEEEDYDTPFVKLVPFVREFLERRIKKTKDALEAESFVRKDYEDAKDKRLIIIDGNYPWNDILMEYEEPLFVVWQRANLWRVGCVRKEHNSFDNRKSLPIEWAGLSGEDMARVSGVPDATFCHNGRFLAVAKSKEGAIKLAQIALSS